MPFLDWFSWPATTLLDLASGFPGFQSLPPISQTFFVLYLLGFSLSFIGAAGSRTIFHLTALCLVLLAVGYALTSTHSWIVFYVCWELVGLIGWGLARLSSEDVRAESEGPFNLVWALASGLMLYAIFLSLEPGASLHSISAPVDAGRLGIFEGAIVMACVMRALGLCRATWRVSDQERGGFHYGLGTVGSCVLPLAAIFPATRLLSLRVDHPQTTLLLELALVLVLLVAISTIAETDPSRLRSMALFGACSASVIGIWAIGDSWIVPAVYGLAIVVDSFASSSLRLASVDQREANPQREPDWLTPDRLTAFLGGLALAGAPPFLSFIVRLQIILDTSQILSIGWLLVLIASLVLFSVAALRQFAIRRGSWQLRPAAWTLTTVGCALALALSVLIATEPLVASSWLGQFGAG